MEKNISSLSDDRIWQWTRLCGVLVIAFAVYLLLKNTGVFMFSPSAETAGGLVGVFLVGLVASFSSCSAVVVSFIVAINASSSRADIRKNIIFNVGRLFGFVLFGAIIGLIGKSVQFSSGANGLLVLAIAFAMIILGINLLGVAPSGLRACIPARVFGVIKVVSASRSNVAPFVLGALTFFLPCGFTQATQLFALSLASPIQSALVMGVFALGTLPVLLGIGFASTYLKGKAFNKVIAIVGVIMILVGIWNLDNGLTLLNIRPFSATQDKLVVAQSIIIDEGDRQTIKMNVTNYGVYEPSAFTVVKDIPVLWEVIGDDSMGCASSLILEEFGVRELLLPGENIIEFTPTQVGDFIFSCSMGMVSGTMHVIKSNQ